MSSGKGFTLIELLVVIAIIALLLSITMPSLHIAKQMAGAAICVSDQKQIMTAWFVYAGENDSKMPGPNTADPLKNWIGAPRRADGTAAPLSNFTAEEEQRGIALGLLYPYYENYKLVHCPSDKRFTKPPTSLTGSYQGDGAYRTYSFILHAGTTSYSGSWKNNGWVLKGPEEIFIKISQIKNPGSKFILVEENDNRGINMGSWVMDHRTPHTFVDPFAVFHNMRSTLGFADGHAEKINWKDDRTEAFSKRVSDGGHFWSDPEEHDNNEDLQWLFSHYPRK